MLLSLIVYTGRRFLSADELADWLWETWRFVRQIFPQDWIRALAGENTLAANLLSVLFGVFMYFPTLVEVPIARMFLDLGMHKGPLLAYLLADPELSIQSIMVTGRRKTATYVSLVAVCSTLAGYLFGTLVSGS